MRRRELKTWQTRKITLLLTAFFVLSVFGIRAEGVDITFKVTPGAGIRAFSKDGADYWQTPHFVPFTEHTLRQGSGEGVYDTYSFTAEDGKSFHYVAGGGDTGFLKTAKVINPGVGGGTREITVDVDRLDSGRHEDNAFKSDSLYLNVNDAQHLVLSVGETFNLIPTRVWQAMQYDYGNYFIEPDYKVEVLNDDGTVSSEWGGKPGLEYAEIKGLTPGVTVLRVTYGPLLFRYDAVGDDKDEEYYNATDPINTGIVVVTVTDGDKISGITTNIAAREYDTVYFDKDASDHAEYSFKPSAAKGGELSARVRKPVREGGAAWDSDSEWNDARKSADDTFTVDLYEGRNVVEVSAEGAAFSEYHVINAKGIKINVKNLTAAGKALSPGDKAEISFEGIKTPLEKIAAIYNPDTCYVTYKTEGGVEVKGEGVQYNLSESNSLTVTIPASGSLKLTNGVISCSHWGDPLDSHRTRIGKDSIYPNQTAEYHEDICYSSMPDIIVDTSGGGDGKEKGDDTPDGGSGGGCDTGALALMGIMVFAGISLLRPRASQGRGRAQIQK